MSTEGVLRGAFATVDHCVRPSGNAAAWWDNSNARKFGYKPSGKAEDYRAQAMEAQKQLPPDPIGDKYQGGTFCSAEYDADGSP